MSNDNLAYFFKSLDTGLALEEYAKALECTGQIYGVIDIDESL